MAEANPGFEDDSQQLLYAVGPEGEPLSYIYQSEDGAEATQYLLTSGDVSQLGDTVGGEPYDANQFLVSVSQAGGQAEEPMDTGDVAAAVLTGEPKILGTLSAVSSSGVVISDASAGEGDAGKTASPAKTTVVSVPSIVESAQTTSVQTLEQSDGTVTIVVTPGKGVVTTPGKISTSTTGTKASVSSTTPQRIVILPSAASSTASTSSGATMSVNKKGGTTLPVRFISQEQMSALPVQTVTLPLKTTPITLQTISTTASTTASASSTPSTSSESSSPVKKIVVKPPATASKASPAAKGKQPAAPVLIAPAVAAAKAAASTPVAIAPKPVDPSTVKKPLTGAEAGATKDGKGSETKEGKGSASTGAEDDEDESDKKASMSVKKKKTPGPKAGQAKKKPVLITPVAVAKSKEAAGVGEADVQARKSSRRSTMSSKLAEWGLLPSSSGHANASSDSDEDSDDVPVIKSVVRTYTKKTPVGSPEKTVEKKQTNVTPQATPAAKPAATPAAKPVATPAAKPVAKTVVKTVAKPVFREMQNKSLMCKPIMMTKATSCNPIRISKSTQTEEDYSTKGKVFVPVPVPLVVPAPMNLYSTPAPVPIPVPVPVPIPCFIPTTRTSLAAVIKQLKELHDSLPSDPCEAEVLKMAEVVEQADKEAPNVPVYTGEPPPAAGSDMSMDMLEMALHIASEESGLEAVDASGQRVSMVDSLILSGKRTIIDTTGSSVAKKPRLDSGALDSLAGIGERAPTMRRVPVNDTNMRLKYSYGINAWRQWVTAKNEEMKARGGAVKQIKTEILGCNADELSFFLSLFVKEVNKPTGEGYAPDSVYYLCLGVQHYLYENGRIDNIFSDSYYSRFMDTLNELMHGFQVKVNTQGQIVCRITEEHLWESRQLGAHSPHVLLNTLIYFNTKHFMLMTADAHLTLSFSNIMKQWKKNAVSTDGRPARTVYLRYNSLAVTPAATAAGQKASVAGELIPFEQLENVENPLRCPVKLYEFYLSKCPETIKHRNDMFYLMPEPSCVPESPVWYSANSMTADAVTRILNRFNVVREIQEAQLNQSPAYYG